MEEMNTLHGVARFIESTHFDELPAPAVHAVKRAFIDTMGVCIAGSLENSSKIVAEFVKKNNSSPVAGIVGGGFKVSSVDAALANGTAVHALDFDDTGAYTQGHPSAPIFPVIIALSEEHELQGKAVVESYVVGVEVLSRLSRAMPMLHLKGWHPTALLGAVAAAASASKLLNLDVEKTIFAMSLAGTQASGLIKSFGTMAKPFHVGRAASTGLTSALLADAGFTAAVDLFDGDLSFPDTIFSSDSHKIQQVSELIGSQLAVIIPGISFKRFPSCSLTHRSLDAILEIVHSEHIGVDDVDQIYCHTPPRAQKVLQYTNPTTGLQAKFSMQFVLACAVIYREVSINHFTDDIVNTRDIKVLMERVNSSVHPDWRDGDDARPDFIRVVLKNGRVLERMVAIPVGHAQNPLSDEEFLHKYRDCSGRVLSPNKVETSLELMLSLERIENMKKLMEVVT